MKNWFLPREGEGSVLSSEQVEKWDREVKAVLNILV